MNDRFNGFEGSPLNWGRSFSCDSYPLVPGGEEGGREREREKRGKGKNGERGRKAERKK